MIFIDTSAFYALEVEDDINHLKALRFMRDELSTGKYGALITTDYVLDECLTLFRMRYGVDPALKFYDKVMASESLKVIWIDEELFSKSLEYFKRNNKLRWSFTDSISFTVMKELGIKEAFTFDRNFEEAGFIKLP